MNDRMGDVTPVLTAYGGEAYERGANITTVEVHVPCRYLLTTYLYALSSANINSNQPTTSSSTLLPLLLCLLFIRKKDPGQAPTGPDARGMS